MNTKIFTLEYFRERLAHLDALPQYALLGVLSGIVAGVVILIFRLTIEIPLQLWLSENNPENFESEDERKDGNDKSSIVNAFDSEEN